MLNWQCKYSFSSGAGADSNITPNRPCDELEAKGTLGQDARGKEPQPLARLMLTSIERRGDPGPVCAWSTDDTDSFGSSEFAIPRPRLQSSPSRSLTQTQILSLCRCPELEYSPKSLRSKSPRCSVEDNSDRLTWKSTSVNQATYISIRCRLSQAV